MDIQAYQRGDMDAMGEATREVCRDVWRLVRRGFTINEGEVEQFVHGITDADTVEAMSALVISHAMSPARRQTVEDVDGLRKVVIKSAKEVLFAYGIRTGRMMSLVSDNERAQVWEGVEDINAILEAGVLGSADPAPDTGWEQFAAEAIAVCDEQIKQMDARGRDMVTKRWVEDKTDGDIATDFDCGKASVRAHERRIRKKLSVVLKHAYPDRKIGAAELDGFLARTPHDVIPPPVTLVRLEKEVLKRVFQEEPASFGKRATYAGVFSVIALAGWFLLFFGVLPSPLDDAVSQPAVALACNSGCTPGGAAHVKVLSPRDLRRVSIAIVSNGAPALPLLVGPAGRSLSVPFGSSDALTPIPYAATIPSTLPAGPAELIAVFSDERLSQRELLDIADGNSSLPGTLVSKSTVPLLRGR